MERTPRRFWTFAITAGAVVVILAAAASGLFQLVVQSVPGYRAEVERYVRELTGRDVRIDQLGLTWRYYYPSLDLNGVALLAADGATPVLQAERLRLGFALTRLLRGDTTPSRLELHGLGVNATVDRDGQVTVQGIETAGGGAGAAEALEALGPLARFSRVRLERCRVNLRDERRGDEVYSFGIAQATLDRGLLGDVLALDLALPATLGDSARIETFFTGELLHPSTWSGTVTGEVTGLVAQTWLAPLLVRGARVEAADPELRLHGAIAGGRLQSARVELRAGPVTARRAQHTARLETLELRGRVEAIAEGWHADIERLSLEGASGQWSSTGDLKALRTPAGRWRFEAGAEYLRVDEFAPWLQIAAVPPSLARLDAVSGSLHGLQLRVQDDGDAWRYGYRARFEDLALPAAGHPAGFSGLRGEVAGDDRGGRAVLQESRVVLEVPGRFDSPTLPFEALEAEVEWRRQHDAWTVGLPQFRWQLWGTRGRGRLSLALPHGGASPVLDLEAQFSSEDVTRAKPLMPQRWGAGLRSWLDRSILAGQAPRASLVIQGPLADFPFSQRQTGRWSLDIDASDVELAYHPAWPAVNGLQAQLHFEGSSLAIESNRGSVTGNPIERASARFPEFATGQLLIDGSVRGETARFYEFLERSPLRDKLGGLLGQTTARGPAAVDIRLDIPVKEPARTQVNGRVTLDGVVLNHDGLPDPIRDIRGALTFDGAGAISAGQLAGRLYEVPLEATIAPQAGGGNLLSAALRLTIDPDGKGASALIPAWLRRQAAGASDWRATLPLGAADAAVRLTTDLVGVELDYPPPLGKAREEARPLALTVGSTAGAPLHITVDAAERLGADLRFTRRRGAMTLTRGLLRLGPGPAPQAAEDGLALTGELAEIDLREWQRTLAAAGLGDPGQAIRRADLRLGLARWSPFALRGLRYQWNATRTGWALVLSGDQGAGEVRWSDADRGLLTARLASLQVGFAPAEAEAEAESATVLDPGALPVVDLDVGKLTVGKAELGHVTLATLRTELGQKTRVLKAGGGILTLAAEGEWRRRAGQSSGELAGDLETRDIATLLRTFGYTPNLDAKAARFKAALNWAPAERGLEWSQARGTVHVEVDNGQLRAVEPGAGRVLGLVNFYALPRRLTLNFRDVVSKGLGFDKITGDFELRDGSATTQNLRVAGPSVRMDVRGRIGLAARDYDQTVTVYPDVSGGVTLGAVLLGGPVAGALALIAQEIMGKPLNQVTQLTYRVTGSWDNPQVTQGATPESAPAPAEEPPAPPAKGPRR